MGWGFFCFVFCFVVVVVVVVLFVSFITEAESGPSSMSVLMPCLLFINIIAELSFLDMLCDG